MDVDVRGALARRWQLAAAGVVVLAMAAVLWSPLPQPVRAAASDWGVMVVIVVTTVALWLRARATAHLRRRRAWQLFALGSLLAAVGNAALLLPESSLSAPLIVVATVAALLVSSSAAFLFPSLLLGRIELGRILADGLVVCLSLLGILLIVALEVYPDLVQDPAGWFLLLPVADCFVVTVLVIMVLRSHKADYPRFFAAAVGFVCIGVADTGFALRQMTGGIAVTGEPTDLGWFVGYLSIALAVLARDTSAPTTASVAEDRPLVGTATVHACLVVATVVLVVGLLDSAPTALQLVVVLAVVALALRELVVAYDDVRLRRRLSTLVDQRTEQLRESAERSTAVARSVGDGILAADLDGRVTYANPAAVTLLGWPPTQLVGQPVTAVLAAGPADEGAVAQPVTWIGEAVEHGRVSTGRTRCLDREGRSMPVQMTVSPLTRHAATAGCVLVFRDLREQERVERLKSEFVSTVSHELRTPLTSIRGVLGLMAHDKLGPLAPQAAPMVRIASQSADRLSRLVEDLLEVGRLQSGRFPLSVGDHDAATLLRGAVDHSVLLLRERGVGVVLDTGPRPLMVRGDEDRIQQVLTNLLSNAAKYAPGGTEVEVGLREEAAGLGGRGAVCFTVTDHGPGIPADKLDVVFDRFVQADQSDTRAKEGTGLGLSIARQLVQAMGGTLRVSSEPWSHTTFTVELPHGGEGSTDGQEAPTVEREGTAARQDAGADRQDAGADRQRADADRQDAGADRQRADADRQRADADRQRADADRQRADADRQDAGADRQKAGTDRQDAGADRQKAGTDRQDACADGHVAGAHGRELRVGQPDQSAGDADGRQDPTGGGRDATGSGTDPGQDAAPGGHDPAGARTVAGRLRG